MKKIIFLLPFLFFYNEAMAKCIYGDGSAQLVTFSLSPKIATDPTIPVGSVLYTKKINAGDYKTFECSKIMGDQYIIESTAPEVSGVTGIQGKPVYETGIDGIGFQISDLLMSKNGAIIPAVVGSTLVPVEKSKNNYTFLTIWLIKTKTVIDTSGSSTNPTVKFSVGNPTTNPRATDRLLVSATIKFRSITYKNTSCDISVSGSSQIVLDRIEKNKLMAISRGQKTPAEKTITMNVTCPKGSIGSTITYWFNPVSGGSASGDGIIDNMLTGSNAASNVGIIFKKDNTPIVFFDAEKYSISSAKASQSFNFTADYYRASDNSAAITAGNVKAMLEVVIQEE
ncbi:fimbrial protein [Klebsiella quasivariicola]|uniref:fimbrial protein n=1 Tax=Klebsiella quasivariicola TaxID=2026240 RepID=UPI0024785BAD|nr:fimbrial protein [Klebsiella quasivariicola]